ncbi:MAG: hydrogenase expression/formation protein HypE [Calditrichia bacterium]
MSNSVLNMQCPIPLSEYPQIVLAHGGGGKLTHQLIQRLFGPVFNNPHQETERDSAILSDIQGTIAMTTDSYVVYPQFFPGGNIGTLAINGTVNDLAVSGAIPLYISAGFILEEGFPMESLWEVVKYMRAAADEAGVEIVTGDTKVVEKGKGDGIYINTTGIGVVPEGADMGPHRIDKGDVVIVNGDIGRHGIVIMARREGLNFELNIKSDCAPVNHTIHAILEEGIPVHCMRDATRGGLAGVCIELSSASGKSIILEDARIPIMEEVKNTCEILGLDPLYVANEGKFVTIVEKKYADRVMEIIHSCEPDNIPAIIGEVTSDYGNQVILKNSFGGKRILDLFSGEQLPRIC